MKVEVNALKGAEVDMLVGYLSVAEVAKKLKVTPRRVRQYIQDNRLVAIKVGQAYLVTKDSLAAFKAIKRKVGRPPEKD